MLAQSLTTKKWSMIILLLIQFWPGRSFSPSNTKLSSVTKSSLFASQERSQQNDKDEDVIYTSVQGTAANFSNNRRHFLSKIPILSFMGILPSSTIFSNGIAHAAMENSATSSLFREKLSQNDDENRFREGRKSIQYLLDHYNEICEGGGDNVRRYLGTVGTTSGLYGIQKVMRVLLENASDDVDIVEYTETMLEVEKSIQQADGSSYMAIFVTTSTSYTPPAKYFADAKIEVKRAVKAMDELAAMIDLKY